MELSEALRTTGAVRSFTDQRVSRSEIAELLDEARFAPSGGNRQAWRVAVIEDRELRRALGALMQPVWNEYLAINATGATAFSTMPPSAWVPPQPPFDDVPNPLIDQIGEHPVMLVVAADLGQIASMDALLPRVGVVSGASVYPFCWSILLAARSRGLGGVMTTFLARREPEAAGLLGLPADWAIAAAVFVGHPVHQPTRLRRNPVADFTTLDRFDGPVFTPSSSPES